jgi:hypothetical protein
MVIWTWYSAEHAGGAMPEFETVSLREAQLRTVPGRKGKFINEYAGYIQQLPRGQAGKLHLVGNEKPAAICRRLTQAAQALDAKLIIKRSGLELYFWKETGAEQLKRRGGRRPRRQEETAEPEQPFRELEEFVQGKTEDSVELGQTE